MSQNDNFLRTVLLADAAASLACGLLMAGASSILSPLLGLPAPLLLGAGLVLLPWSALVFWLARRAALPRGAVWAVVVLNAIWVIESVALVAGGFVAPTPLGIGFVLAQALAVVALAGLQVVGLRGARMPQTA